MSNFWKHVSKGHVLDFDNLTKIPYANSLEYVPTSQEPTHEVKLSEDDEQEDGFSVIALAGDALALGNDNISEFAPEPSSQTLYDGGSGGGGGADENY